DVARDRPAVGGEEMRESVERDLQVPRRARDDGREQPGLGRRLRGIARIAHDRKSPRSGPGAGAPGARENMKQSVAHRLHASQASTLSWSMIFSENRYPLFGIML